MIEIDENKIRKMRDEAKDKLLVKFGQDVLEEARFACPIKTGRLEGSLSLATNSFRSGVRAPADPSDEVEPPLRDDVGRVGSKVPYINYILDGTKPHEIYPKEKLALSWIDDNGNRVFAKKVKHPGIRPQPFLNEALSKAIAKWVVL